MSQISSIGAATSAASFIQTNNCKNNAAANTASAISSSAEADSSQQTTVDASATTAKPKHDYAADFMDYMKKSPAERMRDNILKKLGVTEDDLNSMPPERRAAVEQAIAEEIKKSLQGSDSNSAQNADLQKFTSAAAGQKLSDDVNSALLSLQEVG